jgi:hypothetical protein
MNSKQLEAVYKALAWQNWHRAPDSGVHLHRKNFYDGKVIAFANLFMYDRNNTRLSIVYAYESYKLNPPDPLHIPTDMPAVDVFLAVMKTLIEVENQVNKNDT